MHFCRLVCCVFGLAFVLRAEAGRKASKYNVVMIMFDDLRPAIRGYGDVLAKTPHLDAFMNEGYLFTRAYSQVNFNICICCK